ncbi:unnamed protein product [Sympodiomycopsis kandeliae]
MKFTLFAAVAAMASFAAAAPAKRASHTGTATWFHQNGNPGSCGDYHSDSDYIVAVSGAHHSASNCGKQVTISYGGKTATATIADTCPTCPGFYDLDLSTGLFQHFDSLDKGVMTIDWWPSGDGW